MWLGAWKHKKIFAPTSSLVNKILFMSSFIGISTHTRETSPPCYHHMRERQVHQKRLSQFVIIEHNEWLSSSFQHTWGEIEFTQVGRDREWNLGSVQICSTSYKHLSWLRIYHGCSHGYLMASILFLQPTYHVNIGVLVNEWSLLIKSCSVTP